VSPVDLLAESAGRPGDVVLVGPSRSWTHAQLSEAVDERSAVLGRERAVDPPGAIVPVTVGPGPSSILEVLACWRAGHVPALVNERLTDEERALAREALAEAVCPPGTQVVLWTSGTSGRSRGVALSAENLRAITVASRERLGLSSDDVWLASLSPAHVGGLVLIVRALLLGSPLISGPSIGSEDLDELLEHGAACGAGRLLPTHVSLVPTQLLHLLEARGARQAPSQLRCVLIGGAHCPLALASRAIDAGWPVALTYGATEMTSQIATAPAELVRRAPGTVGLPMPGVEIRRAESGELLVRGPTRALGYVGPASASLADSDGWYHTGDLGRIDEEGQLWITGRRIDRIVSGGATIDAVEVEEAVRSHPMVVDVCVVGVPDDEWGERVAAWVVPVEGEFDLEELDAHVRRRIAGAKVPRRWHVGHRLPRNANGKVDRIAVRARLAHAPS